MPKRRRGEAAVAVQSLPRPPPKRKQKVPAHRSMPADTNVLPPAAYWQQLAPMLHVGDLDFQATCTPLELSPARAREVRAQLLADGFFTLAPSELPWAASLCAMRVGIKRLLRRGWPASLVLMYDESWAMAHQISKIMHAACGCANSFDALAWSVTPSLGQSGFAPHRDRQPSDVQASFHADGIPKYVTCWIALSHASVDASCLYIVPRSLDPGYDDGDDQSPEAEDPLLTVMRSDAAVQSVRACPLRPGGAVLFSHRAMHWGSKGLSTCDKPRVSISFGCSDPSFEKPYLAKPTAHLPFPKPAIRAALVSAQLINYHERFDFSPALLRKFGATFRAKRGAFTEEYAQKTAAEFKAACEDQARGGGAAGAADESDDEEGAADAALDDALDAMLDAQMKAEENLYDDFDDYS